MRGGYFPPTIYQSSNISTSSFGNGIELGIKPKQILFYGRTGSSQNDLTTIWYDVENNLAVATLDTIFESTNYQTWIGSYFKVEGTKFYFKAPNNAWVTNLRVLAY